ncbi:MAG: hypothetical protein ACFFEV_04675 [Candidatus Thorarchaeota archaeon]
MHQLENLDGHYLEGWEEIRSALEHVEVIQRNGRNAKVEIENSNADTKLKITLRTTAELDEYFNSHLRQLILKGLEEDTSVVIGRIHLL